MFGRKNPEDTVATHIGGSEKEWRLIEKVVMANTEELKKHRRWGVFFKLLTFIYLFGIVIYFWSASSGQYEVSSPGGHTAVIDISGVIAEGEMAGADSVISSLRRAVEHKDTRAVILRINSPGGSPVQSAYIYNEINRLEALYEDVPIYSVIVDSGASGAYYIAAATEEIYANGASIVGSIGVTAAGFGFQGLIEKVGIERRQFTSGEHKAFLDPFSDVVAEEQEIFETLLDDVHQQFISDVKAGRGDRLADNPKLFSGLFWTGSQALELGLVDGLKSTSELARELGYPDIVDFTFRLSPLEQFSRSLGVSIAEGLMKFGATQEWELR